MDAEEKAFEVEPRGAFVIVRGPGSGKFAHTRAEEKCGQREEEEEEEEEERGLCCDLCGMQRGE